MLLEFALSGCCGHGPVRNAEGIKNLRVGQRVNTGLNTVRRVPGRHHQVLNGVCVADFESRRVGCSLLSIEPCPVMRNQRGESGLCLGVAGQVAQNLHAQLNIGDGCGRNLFDFR